MLNRNSILSKLLVSLVILTYGLGMSSVLLPLIEYAIDYERIATEECENIEIVELECNGKCYLSEQITEQAVPESTTPSEKIVVQKAGVDPHYTIRKGFTIVDLASHVQSIDALLYDDIILSQITPPPQC